MTTTSKGYPYPIDTDSADVPSDVQALAEAVDAAPGVTSFTATQIAALSAGEKWAGRIIWNSTTAKHQKSDGSTFTNMGAEFGTGTPAATATAGAVGVAETASRSDHAHALSAHKSTHATGGSDALAPSDIGAIATSALSSSTPANTVSAGSGNPGSSSNVSKADHAHALHAHKSSHATGGSDALAASDIGAVALSTITAKGDLYVGTGSATVVRVGVGTDTQVLVADSTQSAGVKWAPSTAADTGFSPFLLMGA